MKAKFDKVHGIYHMKGNFCIIQQYSTETCQKVMCLIAPHVAKKNQQKLGILRKKVKAILLQVVRIYCQSIWVNSLSIYRDTEKKNKHIKTCCYPKCNFHFNIQFFKSKMIFLCKIIFKHIWTIDFAKYFSVQSFQEHIIITIILHGKRSQSISYHREYLVSFSCPLKPK